MNIFQNNLLAKHFMIAVLALGSTPAFAQVSISVAIAPPPLQVYTQPACPDDGYIWTPGYWAYGDNAYYWVPGAWVQPPQPDVLWTPPYWGWDGSAYAFYPGYWGPNVGYYGGINYGYGYGGSGYGGGRWQGGHFAYNTAVNNVGSAHVQNTYADRAASNDATVSVSYNGGKGGVQAQPTAQERQYRSAQHAAMPPSTQQDALKPQAVPPAQNGTGVSSYPPPKVEPQTAPENQNKPPTEDHDTVVKQPDKPAPATHADPLAKTQSHPAPPASSQPHPEAPAKPQAQSNKPL